MRTLKLYSDDFSKPHNHRYSESSSKVIESWFDSATHYAVEDIQDENCLRIVAERLIVRRLIGLGGLDSGYENRVARIEVFGLGTPLYSELVLSGVFVAMAFVPLTPPDNKGRPCLARLYCVDGLPRRYADLSLEGIDDSRLKDYSWFLEGVRRDDVNRGIVGRSWLLAARLLTEVVRKRDVQTARNLAKRFIVTGDVDGDVIRKVEIKRKGELAKRFEGFKWIIPKENDMDIPKRKIEKPATLDEAYKLIESMQSVATHSLFNALHKADFAEAQVQYEKMGADIYALEKDTGLSTLEVVAQEMEKCRMDKSRSESERENRIGQLREIMMWLKQENADCSLMFYMLAQTGDNAALSACSQLYPINAVDENGLTAVDWALNAEEWDVAAKLHSYSGRCNARFGGNKKIRRAIETLCEDQFADWLSLSESDCDLIVHALDVGLSPALEVCGSSPIKGFDDKEDVVPGIVKGTLFSIAIERCESKIVCACLRNGADIKTPRRMIERESNGQRARFRGFGKLLERIDERIADLKDELPPDCQSFRVRTLTEIREMLSERGFQSEVSGDD